ncbi:MAG: 4-hydroxy-tetrahydrodipicolinate synthase [Defluviitaleaceae bacterium]|nr:4-hydroxy-tetrahydrodipicolinate synthase [Defluviitaleaceae bacterium]
MALFTGSGVAACVAFNADGSLGLPAYEKFVNFLIDNGTDAIISCGTTGESVTLSDDEQFEVVRCAVSASGGRVPVIGGAGSNNTAHAVHLAKQVAKAGAQGCLAVTPYYNKPTQRGLVQHFAAIAEAAALPTILYNVPGRTACNIQPATYAELVKIPNIAGVKEASGNIVQIGEVAEAAGPDFPIYSGNDDHIVPVLSLGGLGVISVMGNIIPQYTRDMVAKYHAGDTAAAAKMQIGAMGLVRALFCETNPIPVKTALNLMGMNMGAFRLPLCDMTEAGLAVLKREMAKFGLI